MVRYDTNVIFTEFSAEKNVLNKSFRSILGATVLFLQEIFSRENSRKPKF